MSDVMRLQLERGPMRHRPSTQFRVEDDLIVVVKTFGCFVDRSLSPKSAKSGRDSVMVGLSQLRWDFHVKIV